MVKLKNCSISYRLAEMFKRFFTMATNTYTGTAIQICAFTAFSEVRRRRSTLFEHQTWAISHLGMRRFQASDGTMLMRLLTDVVRSGVFGDHLLAATRRILYEHRIIIAGRRRLSEVAGSISSRRFPRTIAPQMADL